MAKIKRGSSGRVVVQLGSGGSGPSTDPGNRWYIIDVSSFPPYAGEAGNGASSNGWKMTWIPVDPPAPVDSQVETTVVVPINATPGGCLCSVFSVNVNNYIDLYKGGFEVVCMIIEVSASYMKTEGPSGGSYTHIYQVSAKIIENGTPPYTYNWSTTIGTLSGSGATRTLTITNSSPNNGGISGTVTCQVVDSVLCTDTDSALLAAAPGPNEGPPKCEREKPPPPGVMSCPNPNLQCPPYNGDNSGGSSGGSGGSGGGGGTPGGNGNGGGGSPSQPTGGGPLVFSQ